VDTGFARQKEEGEILLVGHSFVRRLRDYVDNYSIGGYKVQFVCRGGWNVPDLNGRLPVEMSRRRYLLFLLLLFVFVFGVTCFYVVFNFIHYLLLYFSLTGPD
jgi:hypothetical protein